LRPASARARPSVRLGVVGAGSFARSVLLPRLRSLDVPLGGVATASGPSAQQTGARFGFAFASTDWRAVVRDEHVDAVLVATRHDLHAEVAAAALRSGKAVFLEKPMALSEDALQEVLNAWQASGQVLQVGFNRRFAPTYRRLRAFVRQKDARLVMSYRVNAGSMAIGAWVHDPEQGGGRLIGEACHMVDLMFDLASSRVTSVHAQALPRRNSAAEDDVVLTLTFADGSLGTLVYASGGDRGMPKERLEVLGGGRSAVLDDFTRLELFADGRTRRIGGPITATQDKGHAAELAAFVDAVKFGKPSPVDPEDAAHVTRVTFAAVESVRIGLPVQL
jgi:predicted dehydrogenase